MYNTCKGCKKEKNPVVTQGELELLIKIVLTFRQRPADLRKQNEAKEQ
jgi:hypothetical protein